MAWYWWALIVVAVLAIGSIKMSVFKKIMDRKKAKESQSEED